MTAAETSRPVRLSEDRLELSPPVVTVAIVVATALAAWFALRHLGRQPFTRDEVASVTNSHRPLSGTLAVLGHREGNMWPYYLWLNGWTHLGGTGEAWVRLPGALCAVASVPALMTLARRLFGPIAAIVSGVVLASAPLLVDLAHFARSYGVVALLVVISAWLLVDAVDRPRARTWIAWGLVSGAMVHFHMLAGLMVFAQLLSLLLLPRGAIPGRALRAGVITLVLVVAPMAVYAATGDSGQTSWVPPITLHVIAGFGKVAAGSQVLALLDALLVSAAAVAVIAALRAHGRSREVWHQGLVVLWVTVAPLALAALSVVKPLFQPDYLVGVLPGLALLIGMVAASATWRPVALSAAALVALIALITEINGPHPTLVSEDLRGAAALIAARAEPGDGIAYAPAFARPGVAFYLDRADVAGSRLPVDLDLQPGRTPDAVGDLFGEEAPAATVAANLRASRRVWLVGYPDSDWHPTPEPVLAVAPAILRDAFTKTTTRRFGELTVALYRRR